MIKEFFKNVIDLINSIETGTWQFVLLVIFLLLIVISLIAIVLTSCIKAISEGNKNDDKNVRAWQIVMYIIGIVYISYPDKINTTIKSWIKVDLSVLFYIIVVLLFIIPPIYNINKLGLRKGLRYSIVNCTIAGLLSAIVYVAIAAIVFLTLVGGVSGGSDSSSVNGFWIIRTDGNKRIRIRKTSDTRAVDDNGMHYEKHGDHYYDDNGYSYRVL